MPFINRKLTTMNVSRSIQNSLNSDIFNDKKTNNLINIVPKINIKVGIS